jgi:DNA-binding winged helix-turn-helix (wHTH) protein
MRELHGFGRFALDLSGRRLYADGVPVLLGSTDIRLLVALVEKAGSIVSKNDLVSRVWGRTAVTDNALYVHVNALRRVIGDECIVNKQGHGYRFAARIQRMRRRCRRGRKSDNREISARPGPAPVWKAPG